MRAFICDGSIMVHGLALPQGKGLDGFGVRIRCSARLHDCLSLLLGNLSNLINPCLKRLFGKLELIEGRRWREAYLTIIGPVFNPEASKLTVARNFLAGIQAWIRSGQLRSSSTFVIEAEGILGNIISQSPQSPLIHATPTTASETLLARAVEISLEVTVESSKR